MVKKTRKVGKIKEEKDNKKIDERPLSQINRGSMGRKGFVSMKGLGLNDPRRPGNKTGFVQLKDAKGTRRMLANLINLVRLGKLEPAILKSVAYSASILLKAQENSILEERLRQIEELLQSKGIA